VLQPGGAIYPYVYSDDMGPGAPYSLPVHPVQLYESAGALLLCALVLGLPRGRLRPGSAALTAFALYAVLGFVPQFFRADDALVYRGFTANQLFYLTWLIAVPMLAIGVSSRAREINLPC